MTKRSNAIKPIEESRRHTFYNSAICKSGPRKSVSSPAEQVAHEISKGLIPWHLSSALLALASATSLASPSSTVTLQTKSAAGVDVLSITPAKTSKAETISVEFVHRESSADCSFKVVSEATRQAQRGDPDDFTEALPDGSYVSFANFKAGLPEIKALTVDVSSKTARFASISVALPAQYDFKRCKAKAGVLEVLFFKD